MPIQPEHQGAIIIFDGVCHLCNWFVQFIIRHDPKSYFKFAAINSSTANTLLRLKTFSPEKNNFPDSVILLENNHLSVKSEAVGKILLRLKGLKWLGIISKMFPLWFRDTIYDLIAKYRYHLFGKMKHCMIPSPDIKDRFFDFN